MMTQPYLDSEMVLWMQRPGRVPKALGFQEEIKIDGITLRPQLDITSGKLGVSVIAEGPVTVRAGDVRFSSGWVPAQVPFYITFSGSFSGTQETEFRLDSPEFGQSPHRTSQSANCATWITASPSGNRTLKDVRMAATSGLPTLFQGESGTGKEVLAKLIHEWSARKNGPFVALNCGALAVGLIDSELFGHVRGAFTGADKTRAGAILNSHGGTLFLDEVADLPLEAQVKLLRFLESGEIRPVGADRCIHTDVRVVSATHKNLVNLVADGKFRQDLYYRLAALTLQVPTLRDRTEDLRVLATRFAAFRDKSLTEAALTRLSRHSWPGNVRELRHAIERACGLAGPFQTLLDADAFSFLALGLGSHFQQVGQPNSDWPITYSDMERALLIRSLIACDGHRSRTARRLGIARSTLQDMMKRHGLTERKRSEWQIENAPAKLPEAS